MAVGEALAQVQRGIDLALELGAEHTFLVYNGSLLLWSIARGLMAQRSAVSAAQVEGALGLALKSLTTAGETDIEWRLRLAMHQARAMFVQGKAKEAAALLASAAVQGLVKDAPDATADELIQLQARLLTSDAAALKKLRDEHAANARRSALLCAQVLRDGATAGAGADDAALAEVLGAVDALDDQLGAALRAKGGEASVRRAVATLPGNCAHGDALAALACAAAKRRQLDVAAGIAQRVTSAPELSARTRASLVQQMLHVERLDAQAHTYTREMVTVRVEAVRTMESLISPARCAGSLELLQDVCVEIWNVALPLLQPSLLGLVAPALEAVAAVLEEVDSPLLELRASLHLELAQYDANADLVGRAVTHVAKALTLDCPKDVSGRRPSDRRLLRLQKRLMLKLDTYRTPETAEEKALALLDQIRSASPTLKNQLCSQLLQVLADSETGETAAAVQPAGATAEPSASAAEVARERFFLWAELMKAAWSGRLREPARSAAAALLAAPLSIDPVEEPDMVRLQAEARYVQAETLVDELRSREGQGTLSVTTKIQLAEAPQAELAELRSRALREMEAGIRLGLVLREDYLVYNGCIYIWNYNQVLIKSGELEPLLGALKSGVEAMRATEQEELRRDLPLLKLACAFAAAYARALERHATAVTADGRRAHDAKDANQAAALQAAQDACKWAAELAGSRHRLKRDVVTCWARLQAYAGVKEPAVGTGAESGAYARLELLAAGLVELPARVATLAKVKELLLGGGPGGAPLLDPELWVRSAQQSLAQGNLAAVVHDCEKALAPLRTLGEGGAPLRDEWRWYALAEYVHGDAMEHLIQPHQAASLQAQLHAQAADHLSTAMEYAARGGEHALVLTASSRLWQHCEAFLDAPRRTGGVSVSLVRAAVMRASTTLEKLDAADQPAVEALRVCLYRLQLYVFVEGGEWDAGLVLLRRAMSTLPKSCHKLLWEQKVRFMCLASSNELAAEMLKLKDFDEETQAEVWRALAQSSSKPGEQLNALLRASEVLSGKPRERVPMLLELGEWLFCNGMPPRDAEDQLLAAADLLTEVEDEALAGGEEDEDAADDAASSVLSATSSGRRSATGGAAPSVASTSALAPHRGAAVSGDDESLTVRHLEQLSRIYIMLARMAPSAAGRTEKLLVSCHYLRRIWVQSAAAAADLEAAGKLPEGMLLPPDATSPPQYMIPVEPDEWAGWTPTKRLIDVLAACDTESVICGRSLPEPHLSAYYLEYASDALADAGLTLHALLPLSLLRHVGASVVQSGALELLAALKQARLLRSLELVEEANALLAELPSLYPTAQQRRDNAAKLALARQSPPPRKSRTQNADGARKPQPRRAQRPDAAIWVSVASALIDDAEWSAAAEWLAEARALLEALDDEAGVGACLVQEARLAAARLDNVTASKHLTRALDTPLEVSDWAAAVEMLADCRRAQGQHDVARNLLSRGAAVCVEAAEAYPASASQALAAQAALQLALGRAILAEASAIDVASASHAAATAEAGALFERAAYTLQSVGAEAGAAAAMIARAEMAEQAANTALGTEALPSGEDLAFEAEAAQLQHVTDMLAAATEIAEKVLVQAAPRGMPPFISLPAARRLAMLKRKMAEVELNHSSMQARMLAANPPEATYFPTMPNMPAEAAAAVATFVAQPCDSVFSPTMPHTDAALLHASGAVALAGAPSSHEGIRARLVRGGALLAVARERGWGEGTWSGAVRVVRTAPVEAVDETSTGEAGACEAQGGLSMSAVEETGASEAAEGETELRRVLEVAIELYDDEPAHAAALQLAEASGLSRAAECARWLSVAQACAAREHWLRAWRTACPTDSRFGLLITQLDALRRQWPQPAASPQWRAACTALSDEKAGCAAWQSLTITDDPLSQLLPLVLPSTRLLLITRGDDGSTLYAAAVVAPSTTLASAPPAATAPKSKAVPPPEENAPTPEPLILVSRTTIGQAALASTLAAVEDARRQLSMAALERSKQELLPLAKTDSELQTPGHGAAPTSTSIAEAAMTNALAQVDELLSPLLAPLEPAFAASTPPALSGEAPWAVATPAPTFVVLDADLAPLPLEALPLLRQPHLGSVSRDLSLCLLARRLAFGAREAMRDAVCYAVDVRNELCLPPLRIGGNPVAVGTAFREEILGSRGVGKDWCSGLIGLDAVPSIKQLQKALSLHQAFVFDGPGALFASLPVEHVALLDLRRVAGCLLFDAQENGPSSRRLARLANTTPPERLLLEEPHAVAALLSLGGVGTVMLHRWGASPAERHADALRILAELGSGTTIGEVVGKGYARPLPPQSSTEASALATEDLHGAAPAEGQPAQAPEEPADLVTAVSPLKPPTMPTTSAIVYGLPTFRLV